MPPRIRDPIHRQRQAQQRDERGGDDAGDLQPAEEVALTHPELIRESRDSGTDRAHDGDRDPELSCVHTPEGTRCTTAGNGRSDRSRRRFPRVSFAVAAASYDRFMGRYSVPLAPGFADLAGVSAGQRVLDVGCGPGALT